MNYEHFDFNKAPKIMFNGSYFGINKYFISMAIFTGLNASVFALVPEDAKRFQAALAATLDLYEKTHGPIQDSDQPIPSPIQL